MSAFLSEKLNLKFGSYVRLIPDDTLPWTLPMAITAVTVKPLI